jgi:hypothetical protein
MLSRRATLPLDEITAAWSHTSMSGTPLPPRTGQPRWLRSLRPHNRPPRCARPASTPMASSTKGFRAPDDRRRNNSAALTMGTTNGPARPPKPGGCPALSQSRRRSRRRGDRRPLRSAARFGVDWTIAGRARVVLPAHSVHRHPRSDTLAAGRPRPHGRIGIAVSISSALTRQVNE